MFVRNSSSVMKKVLMCRPTYLEAAPINEIAKKWSNTELNKEKMEAEHRQMVEAYEKNGVEVVLLEADPERPNAVFSRDFGGCIREGYILGRFREPIRFKERCDYEKKMKELGIPKVAEVKEGLFEGGDFSFLDDSTLVIGTAIRSNQKGINEIQAALNKYGYKVIGVEMPEDYLHLDLCFNLLSENLAVIYSKAFKPEFLNLLKEKGIETIDIPDEAVFAHGCNLQAIGNKRVISLKNNTFVNRELYKRGFHVQEVDITETLKAGGGPHCMTFPLRRE